MKLPPRQIESFIQKPDKAMRVILVYGPDEGKMRARAAAIGQSVVEDLKDPFNVSTLTGEDILTDPTRLNDEANALSMMGGARLIRVEGAVDALTPIVKSYLADPNPDNLVVLEAGDLGTKSSLRKLIEGAQNAAAIPCYLASTGDVQALIRKEIQGAGYEIEPDAAGWLANHLTGDHAIAMNELEKIILYVSDQKPAYRVTLTDVQACCGGDGAVSLDDLVHAVGTGQIGTALRAYHQLTAEGMAPVVVHRSLQNHFRRLHLTRTRMAEGQSLHQAMEALEPKVFFKWEDAFRAQINRWSPGALEQVLNRLARLEAECKQTGAPVETLTGQAILSLAAGTAKSRAA